MVNALDDEEGWYCKAVTTYILNRSCLFAIARLKLLASASPICMRDHYTATDDAYYKACLVEVVEVAVLDPVLRVHIGY